MKKILCKGLLFTLLLWISTHCFAVDVQVQGLFKGAAVLLINGKQQLIKAGQRSPEGVLLLQANTKRAIVEIDGIKHNMALSKSITSNYIAAILPEVAIPRNSQNQYITNASINGKRTKVLVDTGATSIALSSKNARQLGINFKSGSMSQVSTASGVTTAYNIILKQVTLGAITVNSVPAVVIQGSFPETILLGMTYLNHVTLREQGGTLYLKSKY